MKTYLYIPEKDQEKAHKMGAKWDGDRWYVWNITNLVPFLKWMTGDDRKPHDETRRCPKRGRWENIKYEDIIPLNSKERRKKRKKSYKQTGVKK